MKVRKQATAKRRHLRKVITFKVINVSPVDIGESPLEALAWELEGVLIDVTERQEFDPACIETIARVARTLRGK
jgi:hypothetical protein